MVYLRIKRLIDIILSSLGLIILSPVFLVLIIASLCQVVLGKIIK